jgi:sec-independent protein translocase protein TatA
MFGMGIQELLIVGIVAVMLFGRRLPEVARSLGQSYQQFRQGLQDLKGEMDEVVYTARSTLPSDALYFPAPTTSGSSDPVNDSTPSDGENISNPTDADPGNEVLVKVPSEDGNSTVGSD